ncbi:GLUG motif-containing protein [Pseudomonas paraeruginosa]|uniref:GLUG motif-containing protein n=1 Tax=Pseudomonas paraeruginosa TaxID=2994495 RepID=UPI0039FBAC6B
MNKTYALVWNQATGCWNVTSEGTRRRGKSGRGTLLAVAGASLLGLLGLPEAFALPSDGKIINGQGGMHTSTDGKHLTIDQQSQKLITQWNGFDIAGDESVRFNQPNSTAVALNRVVGTNGSQILGKLDANGKVFLVNPNGVVFGKTAQVNVGGLVASTLDISDKDFLDGNYRFSGKSTAQVSNAGSLNASEGGSVALLGARVDNSGVIQARLGSVALGAGEDVSLNFDGNGLLNLQVNAGAVDALAHNGGLLKADGGQVLMTARSADSLLKTVVSNQGVIEAKTLQNRDGRIVLDAGNGTLQVAGRQDASASGQGNGGVVENRGAKVEVHQYAKVDTRSKQGQTGTWKIAANNLEVASSVLRDAATLKASTLADNLETTSIELASTQGDLKVDAPLSWNSGNKLGLSAERGNVEVNGNLRASGDKAELALNARDQVRLNADLSLTGRNARLELNSGKGHKLADGVRVTLSGAGAGYRANGEDYRVIQNLAQLREIEADMDGRYVLGNQIKGGNTRFRSLGNGQSFNGTFDGLGNSISDLSVYDTSAYVGLFSVNNGIIRNLNLDHVWASGAQSSHYNTQVGTLAGLNNGIISNVKASNIRVTGASHLNSLGGLVALNLGSIDGSSASGQVIGDGNTYAMGGLVGENISERRVATITNSRADVAMSGRLLDNYGYHGAGGLVGRNTGRIADSQSAGSLRLAGDNLNLGGLVGRNEGGSLVNVESSVNVTGQGNGGLYGGLVGLDQHGDISRAKATGKVSGNGSEAIGGLVGKSLDSAIVDSSATGDVSDLRGRYLGGLVGYNRGGSLTRVAAYGKVTAGAGSYVGGLLGYNRDASLNSVQASGSVVASASQAIGGLIGWNQDSSITGARATGHVSDKQGQYLGGLLGYNKGGNHTGLSASGNVDGGLNSRIGGLIGSNHNANLSDAHAEGDVSGNGAQAIGGLVGLNSGTIRNSAASGKVHGLSRALGGLVGFNQGWIYGSSASGRIVPAFEGQAYGGLIGMNFGTQSQNALYGEAAKAPWIGLGR